MIDGIDKKSEAGKNEQKANRRKKECYKVNKICQKVHEKSK